MFLLETSGDRTLTVNRGIFMPRTKWKIIVNSTTNSAFTLKITTVTLVKLEFLHRQLKKKLSMQKLTHEE